MKPALRKPVLSEHWEQKNLFLWLSRLEHPAKDLMFAIPNMGKRHVSFAVKMRDEGLKSGVPDMFMAYPAGGWHGLFIELKSLVGRARPEQLEWLAALQENGYRAELCKGAEAAKVVIRDYLKIQEGVSE